MKIARAGRWLVAVGAAVFALSLLGNPTTVCTAVGHRGAPPGGFRLLGVGLDGVAYTPDGGVNTCTASLAYVGLYLGFLIAILGAVAAALGLLARRR